MKIKIETPDKGEEDEIIIRCAVLDEDIMELICALKQKKHKLAGFSEQGFAMLSPKEIYYFESVDNKVFAYCREQVYEVRKKLYELEREYANTDFLRTSKSTIINISKISYLKPVFNGRFEALLKNGETIIISRKYVVELKRKLGI